MKYLGLFLALCTAFDGTLAVAGGVDAQHGQYPWMVSLRELFDVPSTIICGGALISSEWVLTAGHCCKDPQRLLHVVAGDTNTAVNEGSEQHRDVVDVRVHPGWVLDFYTDDLCVLKVSSPFDLSGPYAKAASLPAQDEVTAEGLLATILGWGFKQYTDVLRPNNLQAADVPVISDGECDATMDDAVDYDKNICAGNNGKGSCLGDRGGPLTLVGGDKIVGVFVDGEYRSQTCGYRCDLYTEVAHYRDWISQETGI